MLKRHVICWHRDTLEGCLILSRQYPFPADGGGLLTVGGAAADRVAAVPGVYFAADGAVVLTNLKAGIGAVGV